MHGRPFSGIGNPDVCMGMSHAYKRQSINTFIHTHAYTVIHAYHLVVHAYSCIHPMPICHAYQSGDRHHGRMHTYMDAMHVYMHTLIYILMHILIHTYAYPNNFHRILFIPCSHILFHALNPLRGSASFKLLSCCHRGWCRPRPFVMPASSRPWPSLFLTCLHSHEYRRGPNFGATEACLGAPLSHCEPPRSKPGGGTCGDGAIVAGRHHRHLPQHVRPAATTLKYMPVTPGGGPARSAAA